MPQLQHDEKREHAQSDKNSPGADRGQVDGEGEDAQGDHSGHRLACRECDKTWTIATSETSAAMRVVRSCNYDDAGKDAWSAGFRGGLWGQPRDVADL